MPQPIKLIAHRGASGYAPENTVSAFELALKMGMDFFEFDVQLTKDNHLIIHHDYEVHGTGKLISSLTLNEIKKLQNKTAVKEQACTLPELLKLFNNNETLNIELKNRDNRYPLLADETAKLLLPLSDAFHNRILISSFHYDTLKRMRQLMPKIKLGFLASEGPLSKIISQAKDINCASINLEESFVTQEVVLAVHKNGLKVYVYTVNNKQRALELAAINTDGIFTNYPDLLTKQDI